MSDFEKTSQRDPQEQNSGTSKRYESNSHNMFERRLVYVPVQHKAQTQAEQAQAIGSQTPPTQPAQSARKVDADQTAQPLSQVMPDFYASLQKLGEHANYTNYEDPSGNTQTRSPGYTWRQFEEYETTDPLFELQPEPETDRKQFLMLRPITAPVHQKQTKQKKGAASVQPVNFKGRIVAASIIGLMLLIGAAGLFYRFSGTPISEQAASNEAFLGAAAAPTTTPTAAAPAVAAYDESVIARAVIKPLRSASLEMATSGAVVEILANEGDFVKAGQPLLRLDSTLQKIEVAQAEVDLLQAKSRLQETKSGSRPEEIAAAQAAVDTVKARLLANSEAGVRQTDIAAAQAQLSAAQAQLQDLLNGPKEATLIEARTALQNAEANLKQARSAYEPLAWRSDIGMLPESVAMEKATNEYQAALARYNLLSQPATAAQISEARASVEDARANLARTQNPAKPADVDAIHAEVRKAEADLQLIEVGARPEVVARAEADVKAAEVAMMRAQAILSQTVLLAPFSGLVGDISIEVGEQVNPGKVLVQLGDVSNWRIETSDLTELDITKVQEGAPALIEVDALPGETLTGTVSHIKRWGEDKVGDVVYTVEVSPKALDKRLRWNMTASVTIQSATGALSAEGDGK